MQHLAGNLQIDGAEGMVSDLLSAFVLFFLAVPCGILIPQPGLKPVPPAWRACSLHHQTAREVPRMS